MGVEIVIHKKDLLGVREIHIDQIAQDIGIIDGCAPFANRDFAPADQRCKEHEQVDYTFSFILVVEPRLTSRAVRQRLALVGGQLL